MTSFVRVLDLFVPPDGHSGLFGWIAGYSADGEFLNEAYRRFGATHNRHALALLLDPRHRQLRPVEIPGVAHLLARGAPPFRLQHAKIALLAFRSDEYDGEYTLRLIVSTGNWQRQCLETSLDLAWSIELDSEDEPEDPAAIQCASDIGAAWDFLQWLRRAYDDRILAENEESDLFERWLHDSPARFRRIAPRFFDNRHRSLRDQLADMVRRTGTTKRNYLAMGSGFYQAPLRNEAPSVLTKIFETLQQAGVLTAKPAVDIYVNPDSCQAVSSSIAALEEQPGTWRVRPARAPDELGTRPRTLHAKFIFSANEKSNSDFCNSAWLYLGSGNLTLNGFDRRAGPDSGNAEAGVVFSPGRDLTWSSLPQFLPVQWCNHYEHGDDLQLGIDENPVQLDIVLAPPLPWLDWRPSATNELGGWLLVPPGFDLPQSLEVLDSMGNPCEQDIDGAYIWPDAQPRQVKARWQHKTSSHLAEVPVRCNGLFAAPPMSTGLGAEDMLDALQADGVASDTEMDDSEDGGDDSLLQEKDRGNSCRTGDLVSSRSFVRNAMLFVERIAELQTASSMTQRRWKEWCDRLDGVLGRRGFDGPLAKDMRASGLNLLAPLKQPAFRPSFAEDSATEEGRYYETVLENIEQRWGLSGLPRLGEMQ